jgi:RNA polymerase primary sigma factor
MKSSAVEGLVHAVKLFDPSKGFKFSTYAHWWVRQSINKILAVESRVVYVPQNVYELSVQAQSITAELEHKYHPAPVPPEAIAEKMNISLKRLQEIRAAVRDPVSMNAPLSSSADAEIGELVPVRVARCCLLVPLLHGCSVHVPSQALCVRSACT